MSEPALPLPPYLIAATNTVFEALTEHAEQTAGPDGRWDPLLYGAVDGLRKMALRHNLLVTLPPGVSLLCPTCPVCGGEPGPVLGAATAFCANGECRALQWDMTVSAQDNLAGESQVTLTRDEPAGPAGGAGSGS